MHPKLCALIFKVLIFVRKFRKQKMSTSEIAKLTIAENGRIPVLNRLLYLC